MPSLLFMIMLSTTRCMTPLVWATNSSRRIALITVGVVTGETHGNRLLCVGRREDAVETPGEGSNGIGEHLLHLIHLFPDALMLLLNRRHEFARNLSHCGQHFLRGLRLARILGQRLGHGQT
jgi:hypothetical protein